MRTIERCDKADYAALSDIWERSVRATHSFLNEATIREIKAALIPAYFPAVELYVISDSGRLAGFIGLRENMIEMLFVDSDSFGQGYGTSLVDFAISKGAAKVDVNEQNQSAFDFYQKRGFIVTGRDETDDAGRPYPILHLTLKRQDDAYKEDMQK